MKTSPEKSWISPKVELRSSKVQGKGIFAKENIKKGETIVIWGGEYTNAKGAEIAKLEGKHVMQWDDDLFSIETRGEDDAYFINHSCDPNVWMKDAFTLTAMKNIIKGDELLIDYALFAESDYVSKWNCKCGSKNCRRKITGNDFNIPELQKRYKDHFSPLINKKIKIKE